MYVYFIHDIPNVSLIFSIFLSYVVCLWVFSNHHKSLKNFSNTFIEKICTYMNTSSSNPCFSRVSYTMVHSLAQAALAKHHRGWLNHRSSFPHGLEPQSPRSKCSQSWFPLRPLSLACRRSPSHYIFKWPSFVLSVSKFPLLIKTEVWLD